MEPPAISCFSERKVRSGQGLAAPLTWGRSSVRVGRCSVGRNTAVCAVATRNGRVAATTALVMTNPIEDKKRKERKVYTEVSVCVCVASLAPDTEDRKLRLAMQVGQF